MHMLFLLASFALATAAAQEAPPQQKPIYGCAGVIRPEFLDYITQIKKIDAHGEEYLWCIDRKGVTGVCTLKTVLSGDRASIQAIQILNLGVSPRFHDIFGYTDCHGQTLLVGYKKSKKCLYLYRLSDGNSGIWRKVRLPDYFSLYQTPDEKLVMQRSEATMCMEIALHWNPDYPHKTKEAPSAEIGYKRLKAAVIAPAHDEGLVVSESELMQNRMFNKDKLGLASDLFDLDTCPPHRKWLLICKLCDGTQAIRPITCYHKMPSGELICGHNGLISIWVLKT